MFFKQLKVATRIRLLAALMLLDALAISLVSLFQLKENMLEDRKDKIHNLVEVGIGILAHHHRLAQKGKLSEPEAQQAARESLRDIRYAESDYYFIFDTHHVYVLYPSKPEFEGQNKKDLQDTDGKFLIQELVKTARQGGGFVDYRFPRAGQQQAEPKLSYSALFAPWNWVIGTGLYIDDIDRQYRTVAILLGGLSGALLIGLGLLGWLIGNSVLAQLGGEPSTAQSTMRHVAQGDLAVSVGTPSPGSLLDSLGTMIASLRALVSEIDREADSLVSDAEEIKRASNEVSAAASQQSDATSSMAAAIEQLTVSSAHISENARATESDSSGAMELASQGRERADQASHAIQTIAMTMTDTSDRIRALEGRTNQISSIANVIKGIAGQTNLLALNAAIEAARAGEQGRGFAVVADEVRKLAERTSTATTEIEQMIVGIQSDTTGVVEAMNKALPELEVGVTLANSASESLRMIEDGASHTLKRIHEVADTTREQAAASNSIARHVDRIARMVEDTTVTIQGTADTANRLEAMALNLKRQIARFRV